MISLGGVFRKSGIAITHPPIEGRDLGEVKTLRDLANLGATQDLYTGKQHFCRLLEIRTSEESRAIRDFALELFRRRDVHVLVIERVQSHGKARDVLVGDPVRVAAVRIAILEAEAVKLGIKIEEALTHSALRTQWSRIGSLLTSPVSQLTHAELVEVVVVEIQSAKPKEAKYLGRD